MEQLNPVERERDDAESSGDRERKFETEGHWGRGGDRVKAEDDALLEEEELEDHWAGARSEE